LGKKGFPSLNNGKVGIRSVSGLQVFWVSSGGCIEENCSDLA